MLCATAGLECGTASTLPDRRSQEEPGGARRSQARSSEPQKDSVFVKQTQRWPTVIDGGSAALRSGGAMLISRPPQVLIFPLKFN